MFMLMLLWNLSSSGVIVDVVGLSTCKFKAINKRLLNSVDIAIWSLPGWEKGSYGTVELCLVNLNMGETYFHMIMFAQRVCQHYIF